MVKIGGESMFCSLCSSCAPRPFLSGENPLIDMSAGAGKKVNPQSTLQHRGILSAHAPRSTVNEKNRWYAPGRKNNGDLSEKSVLG